MRPIFKAKFAPYIGDNRLNIGCGAAPEDGWVNMDFKPQREGILKHDMRVTPWPFERGSLDTVLASHVLEHFRDEQLFGIMAEISEVLKVGGHLIGIVPYATSSDGYANPFHRTLWDVTTPQQFCKSLYEYEGTAGTGADQYMPLGDWKVVHLELTPAPDWIDRPPEEINAAMKRYINVVQEMQFVMRRES